LKEKIARVRDQIRETEYKIDIENARLDAGKTNLDKLESRNAENLESKESLLAILVSEKNELEGKVAKLSNGLEKNMRSLEDIKFNLVNQKTDVLKKKQKCEHELSGLVKHIKFFESNDTCPTCEQDIALDFKKDQTKQYIDDGKTIKTEIDRLNDLSDSVLGAVTEVETKLASMVTTQMNIHGHQKSLDYLYRAISDMQSEVELLGKGSVDTKEALDNIALLKKNIKELTKTKNELNDTAAYQRVSGELLKDTGIKTKIIKQYLPVINQLINQYLQVLDFFVHFNLNESFTETIRSRHRDDFTYDSFSEGEKQRIDLSLLFTWRQVAKMKNSVVTNLLVLDETMDSSLDASGVENLMKILHTLDAGTNVFIISHGVDMPNYFENVITFEKNKNFSRRII
jgi:FtsZ-binding cell division protein ZapB